ncbi:MAG: DNA alkylation repair protein [Flavobacteriales bacterium]|nr:DNA alkylation repair protein [Flavobacteriales bacterium]
MIRGPDEINERPDRSGCQAALSSELESHGTKRYREQLSARFAIHTDQAFGTSMPDVQKLAKTIGKDHELALLLWNTGWHEAKRWQRCWLIRSR